VSVFEKTLISCALQTDDYKTEPAPDGKQLILLGFLPDSSDVLYGIIILFSEYFSVIYAEFP
jgi:hypothetical protein